MFRSGKQLQDEQALLGWSMLDHDDTLADNYAFDECSSPSLERFSGDVNSAVVVHPSDTENLRFSEKSASKQASAASALSSLAMLKRIDPRIRRDARRRNIFQRSRQHARSTSCCVSRLVKYCWRPGQRGPRNERLDIYLRAGRLSSKIFLSE
ncbi:hypothetical protein MTO96_047617 [Rhipicephalus appendiculatus]